MEKQVINEGPLLEAAGRSAAALRRPLYSVPAPLQLLTGAGALMVASALTHGFIRHGDSRVLLWTLAGGVAVLFCVLRCWLAGRLPRTAASGPTGIGWICALGPVCAAANLYALYYYPNAAVPLEHAAFLGLGLAALLLGVRPLATVIAGATAWWAAASATGTPSVEFLHFSHGLLTAAGLRLYMETRRTELFAALQELSESCFQLEQISEDQQLSRESWAALLEQAPELVVLNLSADGHIRSLSRSFETSTDLDAASWLGKPLWNLFPPRHEQRVRKLLEGAAGGACVGPTPLRIRRRNGDLLNAEFNIVPTSKRGRNDSLLLVARDATAAAALQAAADESAQRYALAAEASNEGLWEWNLKTNKIFYSPRWKSLLGHGEEEIGDSPNEWFNRIHPEDIGKVRAAILLHVDGDRTELHTQYRIRHRDGSYRWMVCRGLAAADSSGKPIRMAGSQGDITDFKEHERQLLHDAFHDSLTGLANRAMLLDRLERAIKRYHRDRSRRFGVLFLDLDRFKVINDSLGHEAGDQLLIETAKRLETCIRDFDTVARPGGDEFTILLEEIRTSDDATRIAARIHDQLKTPFHISGQEVFTSASIGIALAKTAYETPSEILRDADTAMNRAKMSGQGRHQVFNSTMHAHALETLRLENDLRRAIDRSEFELHYQPYVALKTGQIRGFEALIRWRHPVRGLLLPGRFWESAEETGLSVPIGWWVLREACLQAKQWQIRLDSYPALSMSVNLSAKSFSQPDMVEQVSHALEETGLDPACLNLEITEGALLDDAASVIQTMEELKALDVKLHLDDFGTGYSSLSYLNRFPIDASKIDRSFVSSMTRDPESAQIVATMIRLSHSLKMEVTAEGVETLEQLRRLKELRCEHGQGYFYAKPMPPDEAVRMMTTTDKIWGETQYNDSPIAASGVDPNRSITGAV